jgi:energy-coupling factor transporter ATP-binding protein EcfA2
MNEKISTLSNEVKMFANDLSHWGKYLASKILLGNNITDEDINKSYDLLLEELELKLSTEEVSITYDNEIKKETNYHDDLKFIRLEKVQGVNALAENQIIELTPNMTIIYGANGSGKSGYVRLLKKAFYSKSCEDILPNIYEKKEELKPINAKFTFKLADNEITYEYQNDKNESAFNQFAIFDRKCVVNQLEGKNEFEFRPAGLNFFEKYTEAVNKIEQKLSVDIGNLQSLNEFSILFEGDSEIKKIVNNISGLTKLEDLKKYIPFSKEDKDKMEKYQKEYDDLLLESRNANKEIEKLEKVQKYLKENVKKIEYINQFFTKEKLEQIKTEISSFKNLEIIANDEGIDKFKTDKVDGIGSKEWKAFLVSSEKFAKIQNNDISELDICLFCHQPLTKEAKTLIANYWMFIYSVAEENLKKSQIILNEYENSYNKLQYDLYPDGDILTSWLNENYQDEVVAIKQDIHDLEGYSKLIVSDINNKNTEIRFEKHVNVESLKIIENEIVKRIEKFKKNEQLIELEKMNSFILFLQHKEKFNIHLPKIEKYINDQKKASILGKAKLGKQKITATEKRLSEKYFNQKYIDFFNSECDELDGNLGIDIVHTGSKGKSYRQFKINGNNPGIVLSEGEQKVIAIADFLAEMKLSEVNKGIIFDDPVTSLDEYRKNKIAKRLAKESLIKQVIIFTHDLVFLSSLMGNCEDENVSSVACHWIENCNNEPGHIWLNNSPSYEREYRNSKKVEEIYTKSKDAQCPPEKRENLLKAGFTVLRTCYEVLVIYDLFCNVVQRYNDRVSVESLAKVNFDKELVNEIQDCYGQCCRYMEGHSHSDKYSYKKPEPKDLHEEMERYNSIRKKIKDAHK